MKQHWKVGDWCFHQYELKQIREVRKNGIGEVFCGIGSVSGYGVLENCRPLNMHVKLLADHYRHWVTDLCKVKQITNWPDLSREIEKMWLNAIDAGEEKRNDEYNKFSQFCLELIRKAQGMKDVTVGGVNPFK